MEINAYQNLLIEDLNTLAQAMLTNIMPEVEPAVVGALIAQLIISNPAYEEIYNHHEDLRSFTEFQRVFITYSKPLYCAHLDYGIARSQEKDLIILGSLLILTLAYQYYEEISKTYPELVVFLGSQSFIDEELASREEFLNFQ